MKLDKHLGLHSRYMPQNELTVRCISQRLPLGSYSAKSLMDLREKLHMLMARSIQYGVDFRDHNKKYITKFAHYINSIAKQRITNLELDGIGIITTNWDILLDNSLIEVVFTRQQKQRKLIDIEYSLEIGKLLKSA